MKTLNLDVAGCEYLKRVMRLYSSSKYSRDKEIVADLMIKSAAETGTLIALLPGCTTAEEQRSLSLKAKESLDCTSYYLRVLDEMGVYTPRKVKPVTDLARDIASALAVYIGGQKPEAQSENELQNASDGDGFDDDYIV